MRSSVELSYQLLYFVDHPVEFERWKNRTFIIKYSDLCDYLKKHPNMINDTGGTIDKIHQNWKQFSKNIHGEAPVFFQSEKSSNKTHSFNKKDFNIWKSFFVNNIYCINKLIIIFFKDKLNHFPTNNKELLLSLLQKEDKIH